MERKNPITINESFTCEQCDEAVSKAEKTCRNHCSKCLWSKHVDEKIPGDRESTCKGLMEPIAILHNSKKGEQIVHQCTICGEKKTNKVIPDDNRDKIVQISQRQNMEPLNND